MRTGSLRTALGSLAVILGVFTLFGAALPLVWAHAELREAVPEPGALFRWERPDEVRLRFTQKLESASIIVTNRQFESFQAMPAQISSSNPRETFVPLEPLQPGTYTVNWGVKSDDGHTLEGGYDFTVLPREPIITLAVAALVLPLFGLFIYTRRARTGEEGSSPSPDK